MTKKGYTTNVSVILGISVVLMLFIFVLVSHHRATSDRVRHDRSALLGAGSSATERIEPAGRGSVPAAEAQRGRAEKAAAAPTPTR
jgi:hypothetical protein